MKTLGIILLLFIITTQTAMAGKKKLFEDEKLNPKITECVANIPPRVDALHKWALRFARLSPDDITSWKKNVKYAALLPRLQFGYERKLNYNVSVDVQDNISVTSSGVNSGPASSAQDRRFNNDNNIEITATWYLDELIFNRNQLSISSETRSRVRIQRDLLNDVTDIYFALKRLVTIYKQGKRGGRLILEIERLSGLLDSLTDGRFGLTFKWKEIDCV